MVMAGGAVATVCRELGATDRAKIGAQICLQVDPVDDVVRGERVRHGGGAAASASAEVARTWYRRPQDLPDRVSIPAGWM